MKARGKMVPLASLLRVLKMVAFCLERKYRNSCKSEIFCYLCNGISAYHEKI